MSTDLGRHSRLMVLAVHPDDESVAAAGLVRRAVTRGAAVRVVFLTDGENNPWPQRAIEQRWTIGPCERRRWGRRRRREVLGALATLGVAPTDVAFLAFPDQGLTDLLCRAPDDLAARLRGEIAAWRPTLLVGPSPCDTHPDHSAAGLLLRRALAEPCRAGCDPARLDYLIHAWHRPAAETAAVLTLSPEELHLKRRAIRCHATQLYLSARRFLAAARPVERFVAPDMARVGRVPLHPVRRAAWNDGTLTLALRLKSRPGAFGRAAVYLLDVETPGSGVRVDLSPTRRARSLPMRNVVSGRPAGEVCCTCTGGRAQLRLESNALVTPRFIKVARRFGFFDEAGWCEIPRPE